MIENDEFLVIKRINLDNLSVTLLFLEKKKSKVIEGPYKFFFQGHQKSGKLWQDWHVMGQASYGA